MALTRSFPTSRSYGVTGLFGTIGYTVTDLAGNILSARTTAGITESPAGSGVYIAVALLDPAWDGYLVWDDGSGAPGSYLSERFDATSASTATGPDPTNVLLFINDEGGTLTDLDFAPVLRDSANTYGVKRTDTGNVIVAAGAASMTHVSTGVYSYDPGLAYVDVPLTYAVEYTSGGVTLHADGLFRAARSALADFTSVDDIKLELLGDTNYKIHADGENNGLQADIDKNGNDSVTEATVEVQAIMSEWDVPLPFVSPNAAMTAIVRRGARKIATGILLNKREKQANPDKQPTAGDALIAEGRNFIERQASKGKLTIGTTDDPYTVAAPVAAGPTVDPNGCPLPPVACSPYGGYYSRLSCN